MLSIKSPRETVVITFDFSSLTASISAPVVTASAYSGGTDPSPSSILSGAPQVSGSKVLQQVTAGVPGVYYELTAKVIAADGVSIYELSDVLPVLNI